MGFNSAFKGLNWQERQFSRLLAAEVCASAVVMLDTPSSEVVRRVLATHSICQFSLHLPYRASPCAITFQLCYNTRSQVSSCSICGGQVPLRLAVSASIQQSRTKYVSFVFQRRNQNHLKLHCLPVKHCSLSLFCLRPHV